MKINKGTDMPQNEKKSTLLRQWEMMRMLTVSRSDTKKEGRWDKASAIAARLNEAGYEVTVRTVQRDLQELSEIFPIELNNKNPRDYGWRWAKGANLDIPGMSVSEALAMRLVEIHLKQLLPAAMLEGLNGVFCLAQAKLERIAEHNNNYSKDWLDKIKVVPPTQPLLPPLVDSDIQADIYRALLENCQIKAIYQGANSDQPKEYVLNPLGIIMQGTVPYLVANTMKDKKLKTYALHRFSKVEILDDATHVPEGFDLDNELASGLAEFTDSNVPINLILRCDESVAAYLAETPLSLDQYSQPASDGLVVVCATVNDSMQLRWWLRSYGAGIEVLMPTDLRNEMIRSLEATWRAYAKYQCV